MKSKQNTLKMNQQKLEEFDKRLEEIVKDCEQNAADLKCKLYDNRVKCENENVKVKLTNHQVMHLHNKIYQFVNDVQNISLNNMSKKYDAEIWKVHENLLVAYLEDLKKRMDDCYPEKESILVAFVNNYYDYKIFSYQIYKFFQCLDQMEVEKCKLHTNSMNYFKEKIFSDQSFQTIQQKVFEFIQDTRKGQKLPQEFKKIIECFEVFGTRKAILKQNLEKTHIYYETKQKDDPDASKYYADRFQRELCDQAEKHYRTQIQEKSNYTTLEYVEWASREILREIELAESNYPASKTALKSKLELHLIKNQAQTLVSQKSGVVDMLQHDRLEDLRKLYRFLKNVKDNTIPTFARSFQQHFESVACSIPIQEVEAKQLQNPAEIFYNSFLRIMHSAKDIIVKYLDNDFEVEKAYNSAFSVALNKQDKAPIWLAVYTDIIMRADKLMKDDETEQRMSGVVEIFQLLYQRDVYFKHYQKFLSIRLLSSASPNLEREKDMMMKFKKEGGTSQLTQFQKMILDIEQSARFNQDKRIKDLVSFDFVVNVLSSGAWPYDNHFNDALVPPLIQSAIDKFKDIYTSANQQRNINLAFNLGQGELIYKVGNEKYFLIVTTFQIIIFFAYNSRDSCTASELLQITKIPRVELENNLVPFVCLKLITRQKQDLDEFDDNEVFSLNKAFSSKQKKIRMLPNMKMQPKRNNQNLQLGNDQQEQLMILRHRETMIDSALVRLMKSRKSQKHNELIEACMQAINIFKPDVMFIKKRIEHLIEKEFIKRDDKDVNLYTYII